VCCCCHTLPQHLLQPQRTNPEPNHKRSTRVCSVRPSVVSGWQCCCFSRTHSAHLRDVSHTGTRELKSYASFPLPSTANKIETIVAVKMGAKKA
jgi:hypothetical protein